MKSLKIKLLIIILALSLIISGLVGGIIYSQFLAFVTASMDRSLQNATTFMMETLPYQSFSAFESAIEQGDSRPTEYRRDMGRFAESSGIAFLYLVKQSGEVMKTIEISDFLGEEAIIEWENPAPEALESLATREVRYSKPYTDEYGTFKSLYTPFGTDAILGVDLDISYVKQVRQTATLSFLVSMLVAIVLSLVSSILIARNISKPVTLIRDELGMLAQADADLTLKLALNSKDEIGQTAESFNLFVSKLNGLMRKIKNAIEETDMIKLNVSSSAEETSTAVEQISANLSSIGKQINRLDQNIASNVSAINQAKGNTEEMDDQIISQAAMVEEATAAITEMMASLNSVNNVAKTKIDSTRVLVDMADRSKDQIAETAENFKNVVNNISRIQDMASTINGIAAQTNLLSMNAAIEAAHAGESGRGFAVVAEEIRKLADSAGKSSQAITGMIKDIIASVSETDRHVNSTLEVVEQISGDVQDTVSAFTEIEQSVSELNTGGSQILSSITQINEITAAVRTGSEEISRGNRSMLSESQEIQTISQAVTTGMGEAAAGAGEIVTSMQLLVNMSQELSTIVDELKADFGRFKTE